MGNRQRIRPRFGLGFFKMDLVKMDLVILGGLVKMDLVILGGLVFFGLVDLGGA
tara:strand:+ start:1251 stop:1412 length:162 start_codon:yes stop_codon:yes gene_type:complete